MISEKPKLLIVDDVPSNIHLFTNMLKDEYKIIAATNGKKAIDLANKDSKPDLILLDIQMPNMDGYEVCKVLKENPQTAGIPVIFITSLNNVEDQEKAIEVGGIDYVTKPISKNVVKNKIKTHIKYSKLSEKTTLEKRIEMDTCQIEEEQKQVLVVDDAPQNIQVLVEILKTDYKVSVSTSGKKALQLLENGLKPDLILLDVLMPDMDGYELCGILKKDTRYQHIPIMFITILEHEKDIIHGLELGAVDYVVKPIEPAVLKARVNTHIKLKCFQDSLVDNIRKKDELLIQQSKFVMLGEMFENITHQWKQPLAVISMNVSSLQLEKEFNTLSDEVFTDTLTQIEKVTKLLSNTVDDFRDFISYNVQKQYVDISTLIDKPIKILEPRFIKKSIKVENMIDKNIVVNTNKNYLLQVLINIFNNAIDMFKNLEQENKEIKIELKQDEKTITISILDNGKGIEKDKQKLIFEKYYTTKDSENGTGLGLYMSKNIVETKLNGTIDVENINGGACFNICLPIE